MSLQALFKFHMKETDTVSVSLLPTLDNALPPHMFEI